MRDLRKNRAHKRVPKSQLWSFSRGEYKLLYLKRIQEVYCQLENHCSDKNYGWKADRMPPKC